VMWEVRQGCSCAG